MEVMLNPAVLLMNRLRFRTKFILIVLLCLLPLGLMSLSLLAKLDEDVVFAVQERKGVEYLGPLRSLMVHIAETRGMTNALLNGDEGFRAKIDEKRQGVDADLQRLHELDRRLGEELRTQDRLDRIQRAWEGLKGTAFTMAPPASFKAHTDLIAEVIAFVARVAEGSNLILDPQLDSSYLMDIAVTRIPKMADVMGQVRGLGAGVAAAGTLEPEMKLRLAVLTEGIKQNFDALAAGLDTAYETDPALKARLGAASDKAVADSERFISLVRGKILEAGKIDLDAKEFFAAGTAAIGGNLALFDALLPALDDLLAARIEKDSQTKYASMAMMVGVLLLLVYVLAGFYAAVRQGLDRLKESAHQIAEGDLTVQVELDSRDEMAEIAAAFNTIAGGVSRAIMAVADTGGLLIQAAERLSQANRQTSRGVQDQQAAIARAATAINEMTASVSEVAGSMSQTASAVQDASQAAGRGRQVVSQTVQSINALAEEVRNAAEVINRLEAHSSNINSIVDVIRGIADQTNLLALNAAIEAARAGEQGRGFAVVADEVRTLAARTQQSTHEIQAMIERLQIDTQSAVQVMLKGDECARKSVEQAAVAGRVLDDINANVLSIRDMSTQVASATEEQSAVADEINHNITSIAQVAEQTARDQQMASAETIRVSAMAVEMHALLKRFYIDEAALAKAEREQVDVLFRWDGSLSVGVAEIDRQHQRLVGMINELYAAMRQGRGEAQLGRILEGLIKYTATHFGFEEEMMGRYGYWESADHKAKHQKLVQQVIGFKERVQRRDPGVLHELLDFLKAWLVEHIKGTDRQFGAFLKEQGVG